jgi:uncharacterized protein YfkK (UPF0435 family)
MEESAISLFRKLPETKAQIKSYVSLVRDSVLNGEIDPLTFSAQVSALEQVFKNLKSDYLIKDLILEEAEKYGQKTIERENVKFQIKEVGVKFDFSKCQDAEYEQLTGRMQAIKEMIKERENFLKTIKPDMEVYGSDGRQIEPPLKTSTTQVVVTLK